MPPADRLILTCTCEGTMPVDGETLSRAGCGQVREPAHQLCRSQIDRFRKALGEHAAITVTCTQEAPLFSEVAETDGYAGALTFVNIRETAGWSDQAHQAAPKMAALIAQASVAEAEFDVVSLESAGVALVLGRDEVAIAAAKTLAESLDITVLLQPGGAVAPPAVTAFPVLQGRVRKADGYLGTFELAIDGFADPAPSSRETLRFGPARDGAVSRCDLVVDLTGDQPLFSADELRPGYLRADPRDPRAVAAVVTQAAQMVGTFDKPRYIAFTPELCAHSRSRKTGCTRCLDLCPASAITSAGNTVSIDPAICAGCGQCAAACPTGAASYALPDATTLSRRLRAALTAWTAATTTHKPTILLHDTDHGAPLIDAAARSGSGLPAHVIPLAVNEATQIGPEVIASALAYGAGNLRILTRSRPKHDIKGLHDTLNLMAELLPETGHGAATVDLIQADDPDILIAELPGPIPQAGTRASFIPPSDKRGLLTLSIAELIRHAPVPRREIPLPSGAPFGAVVLDSRACTLCHACVGACPTGALSDNPDVPMLRFSESACVQCGLCAATCPESAITLAPRIDLDAWEKPKRILKEEEPFACTSCGKGFGTKSSIARVTEKLSSHWMFSGPDGEARLRVLTLCEDCRVEAVVNEGFDPHDDTLRRPRTVDDYRNN